MEFEINDIVSWCGVEGEVLKIEDVFKELFIHVIFNHGESSKSLRLFRPDGRIEPWHKEPSLKLVRRAKKKVKMLGWRSKVMTVQQSYDTHIVHNQAMGEIRILEDCYLMDTNLWTRLPHLDTEIEE